MNITNGTLAILLVISICLSFAGLIAITSNPTLTGMYSSEVCPCENVVSEPVEYNDNLIREEIVDNFRDV